MDYTRRDKRLAKNGKVDYSITLEKLYQRDKGICHICRQKVDMNANPNSDMYGSIDHMKPISKGGSHVWNNVKLAHRCCNNIKSNSDYYITKTGQVAMSV
jgi:5-methylcytosine-specific restriction endonuclease McrA